jgi:hypothetical protein
MRGLRDEKESREGLSSGPRDRRSRLVAHHEMVLPARKTSGSIRFVGRGKANVPMRQSALPRLRMDHRLTMMSLRNHRRWRLAASLGAKGDRLPDCLAWHRYSLPQVAFLSTTNSSWLQRSPAKTLDPLMFVVLHVNGAPGTIRTSDPQIRSLVLYPAELRVRAEGRNLGVSTWLGKELLPTVSNFETALRRARRPAAALGAQALRFS